MLIRILKYSLTLFLAFGVWPNPAIAENISDSLVVGRLTNTLHKPPHSLLGNSPDIGGARGSVEIRGFKLARNDGKSFAIRPLSDGYFKQPLPPGEYSLIRQRSDRPSYKEDRVTVILEFIVPDNSIVNLGTLDIALQGEPEESLYRPSKPSKGVYTYRYRYERVEGEEALEAPLLWLKEKKAGTVSDYKDGIVTMDSKPAGVLDSSRFILRQSVFRVILSDER